VFNSSMHERGVPQVPGTVPGCRQWWLQPYPVSGDLSRSGSGIVTCRGAPVPFTSETGRVKAFDAEENDPNFATIYSGDGGWRGIEAASDSAVHAAAGLGNALRHAPSPIVPETERAIAAGYDALSARSQRGWRLLGSAIDRR